MELVSPCLGYELEFARFYDDFVQHDVDNAGYYQQGKADFSAYIQSLADEAAGINLQEDHVPCSHFWLVSGSPNTDKAILGAIRVRHHIENAFLAWEAGHIGYDIAPSYRGLGHGTLMLSLALPQAKALGIESALVVADEDNLASRKVIEANGGIFEKVVLGKVFPEPLARYWVSCQ